jgi:hypothetical protein
VIEYEEATAKYSVSTVVTSKLDSAYHFGLDTLTPRIVLGRVYVQEILRSQSCFRMFNPFLVNSLFIVHR